MRGLGGCLVSHKKGEWSGRLTADTTLLPGGNGLGHSHREFQYYTNNRTNSFVEDGVLYLQPTLTANTIGEENVRACGGIGGMGLNQTNEHTLIHMHTQNDRCWGRASPSASTCGACGPRTLAPPTPSTAASA